MWMSTVLIGLLTFLVAYAYRKRRQRQHIFQEMGIPGPAPHWFWGNYKMIYTKQKVIHDQLMDWTTKFGKFYGYFEGPKPILVTTDVDFLQHVFVKQFSTFHGRKLFTLLKDPEKNKTGLHILWARGESWKRLRYIVNPTFSTGKLRQIMPTMHKKIDSLIETLRDETKSHAVLEVSSYYKMLTMEVIGESAFGMDLDILKKEKMSHYLIQICRKILTERPSIFHIAMVLPELGWFFRLLIKLLAKPPFLRLADDLYRTIEARRDQNIRRQDLLQAMMDAEVADEESIHQTNKLTMEMDDDEDTPVSETTVAAKQTANDFKPSKINKKLSKEEIMLQSTVFVLAGFETTSTTLAYATYQLALNPEVQLKLQRELDENIDDEESIDYDMLRTLQYLDQVVCETLRMYPLGSTIQARECMEDCVINGIHIPKGLVVQADVWSIHYDPKLWGPTDPYTFDPSRFAPETKRSRHSLAWMPFGAGPRNCVGMRFGMLETKLALARVLKNFSFKRCEETEVPLTLTETGSISPKNGVTVQIVER